MAQPVSLKIGAFDPDFPVDAPLPKVHPPSTQQQAVYDWVRTGRGNLILIAVAGAGKTTTLVEAVKLMDGWIDVAAYNRDIADEIKAKIGYLSNVQVNTFHGFGFKAWMRVAPQCKMEGPIKGGEKFPPAGYYKIDRIQDIMNGTEKNLACYPAGPRLEYTLTQVYKPFVKALMSMTRQRALGLDHQPIDNDLLLDIVDHFDLDEKLADDEGKFMHPGGRDGMISEGIMLTREALRISIAIAREVIDHDDMLYMPVYSNCRMFSVNWLLVDEAQDTNPIRRIFARRMMNGASRSIWVGDPHQAIYGFTGADNDSLDIIEREFRCIRMPLTVSFRCPKKVVQLARTWVDHITSASDAPDGEVRSMQYERFMNGNMSADEPLDKTSAILCRKNAPLIESAYALIRRGIPCYIEGRDIGSNLIQLVDKWKVPKLTTLTERLIQFRIREVGKLLNRKKEAMADIVSDRVDTLLALIKGLPPGSTPGDLRQRILTMFNDHNGMRKPCLTLSSVHKSKGREWENVYILGRAAYMPSKFARQPWQVDQERNLMYVAVTRSKGQLIDIVMSGRSK